MSKEDRDIVDKHAMELVMKDWIKNGWKAKDSSKIYGGGRDFEFYKGNKTVYCEVKGTTGDGSSVNLTHTQVKKMKLEDVLLPLNRDIFLERFLTFKLAIASLLGFATRFLNRVIKL